MIVIKGVFVFIYVIGMTMSIYSALSYARKPVNKFYTKSNKLIDVIMCTLCTVLLYWNMTKLIA